MQKNILVTGAHKGTETIEILRRTSIPVLVHKYDMKKNERPFEIHNCPYS